MKRYAPCKDCGQNMRLSDKAHHRCPETVACACGRDGCTFLRKSDRPTQVYASQECARIGKAERHKSLRYAKETNHEEIQRLNGELGARYSSMSEQERRELEMAPLKAAEEAAAALASVFGSRLLMGEQLRVATVELMRRAA